MPVQTDAERFLRAFAGQLACAGLEPASAARWVWQPVHPSQAAMFGPDRDTSLEALQVPVAQMAAEMQAGHAGARLIDADFAATAPLGLILIPGFTHETLRHRSWHEFIDNRRLPHQVTLLAAGAPGRTVETRLADGPGLRIAYLAYPRSNADSRISVPEVARILRDSTLIQRWLSEQRRLIVVGYSHGAPIALELLAGLASGALDAGGVETAVAALLALAGDIGGSYLADDVLAAQPQFLSLDAVLGFAQRHPRLAGLIGLGSEQLRADMRGGVESLAHPRRQAAMQVYAPLLPPALHYYSISALCPLQDYRRRWWQFNLDDWAMYRQALISDPLTAYNDGQVAYADTLLPPLAQVPAEHVHPLGAVRTHHWGVSYRTFNQGRNRFPRAAFYRALLQLVASDLKLLD